VEQELLTLPEHLRSPLIFSGVRVTLSLGLCVCFVDRCLSFCTFSFGYFNIKCFFLFLDGNIRERNFIEKFKLIYYICLVHMLKCIGLYFYYFYLNVFNNNQTYSLVHGKSMGTSFH
jgi:hypothetical protein